MAGSSLFTISAPAPYAQTGALRFRSPLRTWQRRSIGLRVPLATLNTVEGQQRNTL